jgi:hypothetical protein
MECHANRLRLPAPELNGSGSNELIERGLKRWFDIWRSQSITSSPARPILTSVVIMDESRVILGSSDLLNRRRTRSRSVTMPLTCISSSTITTEPIFLRHGLNGRRHYISARSENGAGLLLYSGLSLSSLEFSLLRLPPRKSFKFVASSRPRIWKLFNAPSHDVNDGDDELDHRLRKNMRIRDRSTRAEWTGKVVGLQRSKAGFAARTGVVKIH